eukprot:GFUD01026049.1.p1 GENE.GFUD01026049.1~~GFUD01026049.1.p1  ORF type:complete len:729 (+),score=180.52 GFUD01026049.1:1867-4053(+)
MSYSVFLFDLCIAFVLAAVLLWRYSNWMRQPILVTLAVLTAWYFSFLIIFIIPLDVSNTIFTNCTLSLQNTTTTTIITPTTMTTVPSNLSTTSGTSTTSESTTSTPFLVPHNSSSTLLDISNSSISPDANMTREKRSADPPHDYCSSPSSLVPPAVIYSLWRVVYWSSQLLTWLVLPLMQSFTQAGEFSFLGKLKSSLWDNAIYYASYLFIAIILVIYISLVPGLHLDWQRTKAIAAAASNTWGLTLLVFMMGYGLVEVPRTLWNSSKRGYSLNQAYFKISKLWGERSDAEGTLEEVLVSVEGVSRRLEGEQGPLRDLLDIIMRKVPLEMMERVRRRQRVEENDRGGELSEARMAKLHKQVLVALTAHYRTEAQWREHVDRVYWLEDNHRNTSSNERIFKRQVEPEKSGVMSCLITPSIEWYTRCLVVPMMYKVMAVVAIVMSIMLTWSEVTFFSERPTLSLFALFIQAGAYNHSYRWLEAISFFTICYMCICAYFTIFKVRVLNYYYLAPNHQSDSYTLLFSGALLCRLTPPLCLNFLSLIHMDSHVIPSYPMLPTAYTRVMGHMDVVSIVQDYFNIYFPILLLILTLATYFSIGSRLLSVLGFQQFLEQEELTGELVEEGRELVKREKRRRERLEDQQRNKREWKDTWGDSMPTAGEARQRAVGGGSLPDTAGERDRLPQLHSQGASPKYSANLDDLDGGETVLWEAEAPPGKRNKQPPRNIFDDI